METDTYDVRRRLRATKKIFDRACSQIVLLTNKVEDAKIRYNRAKAVKRLSFKYNSQLRVTSLEGLRNAIYQYASSKCEEIDALQDKHKELTGDDYDFEPEDEDSGSESDDDIFS